MAQAKTAIAYENDTHNITIQPTEDGMEKGVEGFTILINLGMTAPEGDKRPSRRFRVFRGDVTIAEVTNARACVEKSIQANAQCNDPDLYQVDAAIEAIKALIAPPENKEKDWSDLSNADDLKKAREVADKAAQELEAGSVEVRKGLFDMSQAVASVAKQLTKTQFAAWVETGPDALKTALNRGKNSLAEFVQVGRFPKAYFDAMPETTNSPKSYQRNLNLDKNELAGQIVERAYSKKKDDQEVPTIAVLNTAMKTVLMERAKEETRTGMLAGHIHSALSDELDGFKIMPFAFDEKAGGNTLVAAKKGDGDYVSSIHFGTGNRPSELVAAIVTEYNAQRPAMVAEKEERENDREAAAALLPRTFAEYGVKEAAMHLANILQAHEAYGDVFDELAAIVESAEKRGWKDAMADAKANASAEAAEAADAEAEDAADDAA